MVGLLATHALAGQQLNYTRCVFQKVPRATCAHEGQRKTNFFKDGPTASRAEAFALCDADPKCEAVQQYGAPEEITDGWAERCGAGTCYMKCKNLGKDGCGRTMLSDRRRLSDVDDEILLDDADVDDAMWVHEGRRLYDEGCSKGPFQHVYTCRPHEKIGIRSPVAFWLCLMAAIFGGHLFALAGVKLGVLLGYKKGPCTLLGWSLFSWFLGAFFVTEGFGFWTGYFGPTNSLGDEGGCDEGLLGAAIGIHSAAGFLLIVALLGMLRWRLYRREARVDAFVPKKPLAQLRVRVTCPADGYGQRSSTPRAYNWAWRPRAACRRRPTRAGEPWKNDATATLDETRSKCSLYTPEPSPNPDVLHL